MTLYWHSSEISSLGDCVDDTPTETGLKKLKLWVEWTSLFSSPLLASIGGFTRVVVHCAGLFALSGHSNCPWLLQW